VKVHEEILGQAKLFLMAGTMGIGMIFVYDLLRIFRRVASHGTLWIAIEDMFFWVGCAFWLFHLMYQQNDGNIRGFVILGVLLGMLLYQTGCSRFVIRIGTAVLRALVSIIARLLRWLSAPFRYTGRLFVKAFGQTGRMCKKNHRFMKKRLKKIIRAVKIGVCKL
jgi:spore cortex biosynthesis protein YabQ